MASNSVAQPSTADLPPPQQAFLIADCSYFLNAFQSFLMPLHDLYHPPQQHFHKLK